MIIIINSHNCRLGSKEKKNTHTVVVLITLNPEPTTCRQFTHGNYFLGWLIIKKNCIYLIIEGPWKCIKAS